MIGINKVGSGWGGVGVVGGSVVVFSARVGICTRILKSTLKEVD